MVSNWLYLAKGVWSFVLKHNCYVALLQDDICSVLNLCTFAFARVTDICAEHLEE
jgi:hypothetical protein